MTQATAERQGERRAVETETAEEKRPPTPWERAKPARMLTISEYIRRARLDRGWTQEELAERTTAEYEHIATGHIGRMESPNGMARQGDMTLFRLWAILAELGLTLADMERLVMSAGAPPMPIARREQQVAALSAIFLQLDERDADTLMEMARTLDRRPRTTTSGHAPSQPLPNAEDEERAHAHGARAMEELFTQAEDEAIRGPRRLRRRRITGQ